MQLTDRCLGAILHGHIELHIQYLIHTIHVFAFHYFSTVSLYPDSAIVAVQFLATRKATALLARQWLLHVYGTMLAGGF